MILFLNWIYRIYPQSLLLMNYPIDCTHSYTSLLTLSPKWSQLNWIGFHIIIIILNCRNRKIAQQNLSFGLFVFFFHLFFAYVCSVAVWQCPTIEPKRLQERETEREKKREPNKWEWDLPRVANNKNYSFPLLNAESCEATQI